MEEKERKRAGQNRGARVRKELGLKEQVDKRESVKKERGEKERERIRGVAKRGERARRGSKRD